MKRFELDAEQTDAILELKLYRLARLEILVIRKELDEKRKRGASRSRRCSRARPSCWSVVRGELEEIAKQLRRHSAGRKIGGAGDEPEFAADDFIVDEDANVVVTRDGWVKRVRELKDPRRRARARATRCSPCCAGSTQGERSSFFTNFGIGVRHPDHRRAGADRLRRADAEAVQVQGRRADRRAR